MERLTDKYGTTKCDNIARVLKNGTTNKFVIGGKAIIKLKEFEDFMEENEFADLEEVKDILDNVQILFRIWEIVREHYGDEVEALVEEKLEQGEDNA